MNLGLIVILPLLGAALPVIAGKTPTRCALAAASAPLLALLGALAQAPHVFTDGLLAAEPLRASWSWLPQQGLNIALRLDGLALLFVLLILGIGLLVILYARYYLSAADSLPRLYALLLLFMSAMLGVVTADNLLLLCVFWELTSLTSFLLIGYWSQHSDARRGARLALSVTGAGGLCLLAGVLILGHIAGGFDLDRVFAARAVIQQHPLYPCALLLILLGAFTKSAQFPFYFWLPHAMAAPTPVSAYLHSATMVKLGVFLLARLYPALAGSDYWFYGVTGTGMVTLLFGAYMALFQHDLKGLLAFSTISHLGLITLLFGLGTPLAVVAALFHIINHAIFKASLFMAAGVIDHETGTRDIRRLNGLWRYMPHTAVLAMVAAAAMAGVPLLNGFLSKEMFFSETLTLHQLGGFATIVPLSAVVAGIFAVAYSLRFIHDVFFNAGALDTPKFPPHEPPRYMKVPIEILVVLCLLVGVLPNLTVAPLLQAAARATLSAAAPAYSLAVWHGFNTPLLMSLIAMLGGVVLYALRKPLFIYYGRLPTRDAKQIYGAALQKIIAGARRLLRCLDRGSLRGYLAWVIGAAIWLVASALLSAPQIGGGVRASAVDGSALLYLSIAVCAALLVVFWQRQRLRAILALGVVGLMSALIFARFSAPDLALTQIAVEVVSTLLLLLALKFLPQRAAPEIVDWRRARDILFALAGGAAVALLAYAVMTRPIDSISQYFLEHSVPDGGGRNVVNVILVDFRGFDTLGEITVLLIAAVAIVALLEGIVFDRSERSLSQSVRSRVADRDVLLPILARLLLPLALVLALYLMLRGHNAPGGGFVGGLLTAVALLLQYIAHGRRWSAARLRLTYLRWAGAGVLLALATGVASWIYAAPFLTSAVLHWQVPLLGEVELASALVFDAGVYAVVVGVVLLILSRLANLDVTDDARKTGEAGK